MRTEDEDGEEARDSIEKCMIDDLQRGGFRAVFGAEAGLESVCSGYWIRGGIQVDAGQLAGGFVWTEKGRLEMGL